MIEEWKEVSPTIGDYIVSNTGRIKNKKTGRELKGSKDSHGYCQVNLNRKLYLLHRLVADAFLNAPNKEVRDECTAAGINYIPINHIDNNRQNNVYSNLEWCSPKHNIQWALNQGRVDYSTMRGSNSYCSILAEGDVLAIVARYGCGDISQQSLADIYGVKQITISNILTGRSWSWLTGIERKQRSNKTRGAVAVSCH